MHRCRVMIDHDLQVEQSLIDLLRRLAVQAESLGDPATRHLYDQMMLKTQERAYHLGTTLFKQPLRGC